jgi:hypothetical protein
VAMLTAAEETAADLRDWFRPARSRPQRGMSGRSNAPFQGRGQEARVHQVQRAGGPGSRGLGNEPLEALQNDGHAPGEFAPAGRWLRKKSSCARRQYANVRSPSPSANA